MNIFMAELIGTALLILLGNGVVANVVLEKTKGQNSGWIVITMGWAMAVFVAVYCVSKYSGAHINPAVSFGLFLLDKLSVGQLFTYVSAQFIGASIGSVLVWVLYHDHFNATKDGFLKRAVFCTDPAIKNNLKNFFSEVIGTFVLVLGVLFLVAPEHSLGSMDALPVALLVLAIGLSLGGTTGYAINPARDIAPRLTHQLLPIKNKASSDWGYAIIPMVGPLLGSALAAGLFSLL